MRLGSNEGRDARIDFARDVDIRPDERVGVGSGDGRRSTSDLGSSAGGLRVGTIFGIVDIAGGRRCDNTVGAGHGDGGDGRRFAGFSVDIDAERFLGQHEAVVANQTFYQSAGEAGDGGQSTKHTQFHRVGRSSLVFDHELNAGGHPAVGDSNDRHTVQLSNLTINNGLAGETLVVSQLGGELALNGNSFGDEAHTTITVYEVVVQRSAAVQNGLDDGGLRQGRTAGHSAGTVGPSGQTVVVDLGNDLLIPDLLQESVGLLDVLLILHVGDVHRVTEADVLRQNVGVNLVLNFRGGVAVGETVSTRIGVGVQISLSDSPDTDALDTVPVVVMPAPSIGEGLLGETLVKQRAVFIGKINSHD